MALIKIIAPGGTIANTGHGLIGIDQVLKDIPQAKAMADFEVFEATRVRSGSLRLSHWLDVARAASVAAGAKGIVMGGYAYNGRPSAGQLAGIEKIAASGIPVVLSNRAGQGRIPVDWNDPFIQGDSLMPPKARILLMLALTKTNDPRELQRIFNEY